jgi:hypothetical protein
MPDETPAARYRRLARESLETANTFPHTQRRDALLKMAQVWERLADEYADATPPFSQSGASEQPAMQQQQQVQPKDEKKS